MHPFEMADGIVQMSLAVMVGMMPNVRVVSSCSGMAVLVRASSVFHRGLLASAGIARVVYTLQG